VCKVWREIAGYWIWHRIDIDRRMGIFFGFIEEEQKQEQEEQEEIQWRTSFKEDLHILPAFNKLIAHIWQVTFYEVGKGKCNTKITKLLTGATEKPLRTKPWFSTCVGFIKEIWLHHPYVEYNIIQFPFLYILYFYFMTINIINHYH